MPLAVRAQHLLTNYQILVNRPDGPLFLGGRSPSSEGASSEGLPCELDGDLGGDLEGDRAGNMSGELALGVSGDLDRGLG